MLYKEEFVSIGRIRKSHGYSGHARVDIADEYYQDFSLSDFIFLEVEGYKVPFKITERIENKHLLIKLNLIDSPADLLPYHQADIYLLEKELTVSKEILEEKIDPLIGMEIVDSTLGSIGTISRIEEYPQQIMAFVLRNNEEIMIPLHESLIEENKEGKIIMNLPEGLLEL